MRALEVFRYATTKRTLTIEDEDEDDDEDEYDCEGCLPYADTPKRRYVLRQPTYILLRLLFAWPDHLLRARVISNEPRRRCRGGLPLLWSYLHHVCGHLSRRICHDRRLPGLLPSDRINRWMSRRCDRPGRDCPSLAITGTRGQRTGHDHFFRLRRGTRDSYCPLPVHTAG
jgi:hypothetical protein